VRSFWIFLEPSDSHEPTVPNIQLWRIVLDPKWPPAQSVRSTWVALHNGNVSLNQERSTQCLTVRLAAADLGRTLALLEVACCLNAANDNLELSRIYKSILRARESIASQGTRTKSKHAPGNKTWAIGFISPTSNARCGTPNAKAILQNQDRDLGAYLGMVFVCASVLCSDSYDRTIITR
jgi:hypothetical protein